MDSFTPRAQQVLIFARKEADRFNHNYVGTEHLLLGIIKLGEGTAANILKRLNLDLEAVRREVKKQVGTDSKQKIAENVPYTPRTKKVLVLAAKEASALSRKSIDIEHILFGLLLEREGIAVRVLKSLIIDIERVRREILKELDPDFERRMFLDEAKTVSPSLENIKENRIKADTSNLPSKNKFQWIRSLPKKFISWLLPNLPGIFTHEAQQVLALARKEANRLKHNFVSTEHLLLGITKLDQGFVIDVLKRLNIDPKTLCLRVEKFVGIGSEHGITDNIPYTPRVKNVLVLARKEAKTLHKTQVGAEHILLGLILEETGVAAHVLKNSGVDIQHARLEISLIH